LSSPVIFDGRNIYDREEIKMNEFQYYCIGVDTTR
jgi:UDPglucose 6-dehydrogenase